MEIAYAAYTESATFMLDAKGIVLWVAPSPSAQGTGEMWRGREAADRCVGAQYVASIDMEAAGGLVELPKIGSPLIFAAVDEGGRVSLLRSGPLQKFEAKTRRTSGVHSRPTARTPFAETGNPYEDEVATVKCHPRDLMYAATPLTRRSERPAAIAMRESAREFFPVASSQAAPSKGAKTIRMDPARM
ncbi:MAG: hypothetical protein ABI461_09580, partial [Polyangiaceae bacterium]